MITNYLKHKTEEKSITAIIRAMISGSGKSIYIFYRVYFMYIFKSYDTNMLLLLLLSLLLLL